MRLDIRYRMRFEYDAPVREAHNELRVRPRDLPDQRLLAHRLTSDPIGRVMSFSDYWGTTVDHVGLMAEHMAFEIVAEAAVETRPRPDPAHNSPDDYLDDQVRTDEIECMRRSPHVEWTDQLTDVARDATAGNSSVAERVQATVQATRQLITYERDSTHIGISLADLVDGGKGVCQDYAHLNIGLLRSIGIPARYVSGYLFAVDETAVDDTANVVSVQTHAWAEAALPNGRWLPIDPTNDQTVGERHVVIGYGRDYDDVAPVRGVYAGAGRSSVDASVEMRRMEPIERSMTGRSRRRIRPVGYLASPDLSDQQAQQQQQQ